jgi:hypothetical protein
MRNLLALIGAVVVLFAGLGWYLGWYTFALEPGANGKQRIQLDVDTPKIAADAEQFGKTVGAAVKGVKGEPQQQSADFVGPPLPPDMPTRNTTNPTPPTSPGLLTPPTSRN